MNKEEKTIMEFIAKMAGANSPHVPVGVSNRHIHLSQEHLDLLFGSGYKLTAIKDLSQPGQFACEETVDIKGEKGEIKNVRILGPVRPDTQIELLAADTFKLDIPKCIRLSGDLEGSPGLTITGPLGTATLRKGAIVAKRHIHMTPQDAARFGFSDGQAIGIKTAGDRGGIFGETIIRVSNSSALDCHIDTEESNAMGLNSSSEIVLVSSF